MHFSPNCFDWNLSQTKVNIWPLVNNNAEDLLFGSALAWPSALFRGDVKHVCTGSRFKHTIGSKALFIPRTAFHYLAEWFLKPTGLGILRYAAALHWIDPNPLLTAWLSFILRRDHGWFVKAGKRVLAAAKTDHYLSVSPTRGNRAGVVVRRTRKSSRWSVH